MTHSSGRLVLPPLLEWLTSHLDVGVREHTLRAALEDVHAYQVDLSRFRLKLGEDTPCVQIATTASRTLTPVQLKRLLIDVIIAEGWRRRNVLVLVDGHAEDLIRLCQGETNPPLVLDLPAQERIMSGPDTSILLLEEISRQAPITALSTYETSAPVTGAQFFGRERELRHLLTHASFFIMGNRRMGKTSLILETLRLMRRHAGQEIAGFYFDCSKYQTKPELYCDIVRYLDGPREMGRVFRDPTFSIENFLLRVARGKKRKIVLALDEVDRLLGWDVGDNWATMAALRAACVGHHVQAAPAPGTEAAGEDASVTDGAVRVLMGGFRLSEIYKQHGDTPIFNFARPIYVRPFEYRDTKQLVQEPMLNLGLKLSDREAIAQRIHDETGGQPNLVQYYCQFIVEHLEDTGQRQVEPALLDAILLDDTMRRRIAGEMLENSNNLEQLIVFCFVQDCWHLDHQEQFTLADADGWLHKRGMLLPRTDLERALAALEATGLLTRTGREYAFTLRVLPRMLQANYDLDYQIAKIQEEGL